MSIGFSGDGFVNLLLLLGGVAWVVASIIGYLLYKKGVDVSDPKIVLGVAFSCAVIFLVFPMWFTDMDFVMKFLTTIVMLAIPLANALSLERALRFLRQQRKEEEQHKKDQGGEQEK